MSVFTSVSRDQLSELIQAYPIGQLTQFEGIDGGTDNSNYFVSTTEGQYVLTIFERLSVDELPFYLGLGDQLHAANCQVAQPIHDKQGVALKQLANKPAVLFQRLTGKHIAKPEITHCQQMGQALAMIHKTPLKLETIPTNPFGLAWVLKHADFDQWQESEDRAIFELVLERLQILKKTTLPTGIIHADLFHDNALFEGSNLTGIIDWYFACEDWYLLDLAILLNDWCFNGNTISSEYANATIASYQMVNKLSEQELSLLPTVRLLAAARFWLSRTLAWVELKDTPQQGITIKPPAEIKKLVIELLNLG